MANSYTRGFIPDQEQNVTPQPINPPSFIGFGDNTTDPYSLENRQRQQQLGYNLPSFIKKGNGLNLQEGTSIEMAKRVIGNNLRVRLNKKADHKLKDIINKLDEDNNFMETGYNLIKQLSVYGMVFCCLDVYNGSVVGSFTKPYQIGNYNRFKNKIVSAELVTRINQGSGDYGIQRKTLKNNRLSVDYFVGDPATSSDSLSYKLDENKNLIRANKPGEIYELKLKAEPIILFKNMPVRNPGDLAFADAYPDAVFIHSYQTAINQVGRTMDSEIRVNITRVYLRLSQAELNDLQRRNQNVVAQFQQNGILILPSYTNAGEPSLTTGIEVQMSDPKLAVYLDTIERIFDMYSAEIGFSTSKQKPANFRTATGVRFIKQEDTLTVMIRRNYFRQQFKRLIVNSVLMTNPEYQKKELEASIEIYLHQIINEDNLSIINEEKELIGLGLSTPIQALMRLKNVSEDEAADMIAKNMNGIDQIPNLSPEKKAQLEENVENSTINQANKGNMAM